MCNTNRKAGQNPAFFLFPSASVDHVHERALPEPDAGRAQVTCEHGRRSAEAA
ncbi:MAG: hypothetical protein Q8P82_00460 [bacterium]|nr:hypothetical protein [bacterium]